MYSFRTDLADERAEIIKSQSSQESIDGIYTENISYDKIGIDFQQYIGYSVPPIYLD